MWQSFIDLLVIPGELVLNLFVSVSLSFVLALGIALLYRRTHRGLNYEQSFISTLVLMAPIITLVMMFIRGDLVLSLGLVGSLSIIRFRTPIKDTRDMVFLFWVIAIGLGCGTDNWTLVTISTVLLSIVTALLYIFEYGTQRHSDFVLVLSGQSEYSFASIEEILREYTTTARVRSHESQNDIWETVFELRFSHQQERSTDRLIKSIKQIDGITRVSLLAPQLSLPM
jgi:hypothetical protein